MKEKLVVANAQKVAAPMAARAVGLCEGCPMARFCKKRGSENCPSPAELASAGANELRSIKTSYRRELMDDSVPFVRAEVRPKAPSSAVKTSFVNKQPPKKPPTSLGRRANKESLPEIVAEALIISLGMRAARHAKN